MRYVWYAALFLGGASFCYLMIALGVVDVYDGIPGTVGEPWISEPTYLSFVGVLLTAVTVVLTAVAIGVGIVAAYTFQKIETDTQRQVGAAIDKAVENDRLMTTLSRVVAQRLQARNLSELEPGFDRTNVEGEDR